MRGFLTLLSALLTYTTAVYATALTYRVEAHETACFFATTVNKGTKLAFYFAVRRIIEPTFTTPSQMPSSNKALDILYDSGSIGY